MSITFKDIQEANKNIQTTDIKGKQYAEVNQRIKAFRMLYPQGFITTRIISNEDGVCVMTATAGYYEESGRMVVLGTGTAYEKEGSTYINKTSYIENCETSCIGRCLATLGLGVDTSVASAEEVQNAIANKDKPLTINKSQWEDMKMMFTTEQIKEFYKELGITRGTDIPVEFYEKKRMEFLKSDQTLTSEQVFY